MPKPCMLLFVDAVAFAAAKHRTQRRKDVEASPYINHPIALAHVLAFEAQVSDEHVLAAAMLHDTLEDTQTSFAELKQRMHLGRVRLRRVWNVAEQFLLAATAQNLKRLVRFLVQRPPTLKLKVS